MNYDSDGGVLRAKILWLAERGQTKGPWIMCCYFVSSRQQRIYGRKLGICRPEPLESVGPAEPTLHSTHSTHSTHVQLY